MKKSSEKGCVFASACPSRQILQHLTGRWGALVLVALSGGTKRFSELRREIQGVSERMLTQTLQQLEGDHIINRHSYNTVPPKVEYELTHFGKQAAERMLALVDWVEDTLPEILAEKKAA